MFFSFFQYFLASSVFSVTASLPLSNNGVSREQDKRLKPDLSETGTLLLQAFVFLSLWSHYFDLLLRGNANSV